MTAQEGDGSKKIVQKWVQSCGHWHEVCLDMAELIKGREAIVSLQKQQPTSNLPSTMTGNTSRLEAVSNAISRSETPDPVDFTGDPTGGLFGINTFNLAVMKEKLSSETYGKMIATIEEGGKLDMGIADEVANAMKDWAMEKGATHFTHVFYPLTGFTAEKHDSFYDPGTDGAHQKESEPKERQSLTGHSNQRKPPWQHGRV